MATRSFTEGYEVESQEELDRLIEILNADRKIIVKKVENCREVKGAEAKELLDKLIKQDCI